MSEVLTRRPPAARASSLPLVAIALAAAVVALALVVGRVTRLPARVDRLSFENATRFPVNVAVRSSASSGRLDLGAIPPGRTSSFAEVVDQGGTWRIRFTYAGVDGGTFSVSRAELRRQAWKVAVPAEVDRRLAAAGLTPIGD